MKPNNQFVNTHNNEYVINHTVKIKLKFDKLPSDIANKEELLFHTKII